MNILVTGGNGQLGNEMQIVSKNSKDTYYFTDVCEGYEKLDITDLEAIRKTVREKDIKCIVNCAAWTNVDGAEDPAKFELVEKLNATAPENLAKAMKEVGGLLVHISTDYVFGKEPYNIPCREDQQGTPTGVYGLTKLHGEQNIIRVMSSESSVMSDSKLKTHRSSLLALELGPKNSKPGYIIIRTAWLYSEFGKNFCKTMLNLTATKPRLNVVFDQCGTPTYAYDLAQAIRTIIETFETSETPETLSGIYHYSNEGVCSWYDFTKMIQQIATEVGYYKTLPLGGDEGGLHCDIQPCHSNEYPSPVTRPSYSVFDKTKIKETFGIKIPYWTDSLKKCITNLTK